MKFDILEKHHAENDHVSGFKLPIGFLIRAILRFGLNGLYLKFFKYVAFIADY